MVHIDLHRFAFICICFHGFALVCVDYIVVARKCDEKVAKNFDTLCKIEKKIFDHHPSMPARQKSLQYEFQSCCLPLSWRSFRTILQLLKCDIIHARLLIICHSLPLFWPAKASVIFHNLSFKVYDEVVVLLLLLRCNFRFSDCFLSRNARLKKLCYQHFCCCDCCTIKNITTRTENFKNYSGFLLIQLDSSSNCT